MWSIEFSAPNVGAAHVYVEETIGRGTRNVVEAGRLGWQYTGSQADVERIAADLDEAGIEHIVTPGQEQERLRTVRRCEVPVRSGGGLRACDRPLDERGYCDRAGDHIES